MILDIKKPSSFFTTDKKVFVYDDRGNIFYMHPNRTRKLTFNLPVGKYSTNNTIKQVGFIPYVPFVEHFSDPAIHEYRVYEAPNKHKASIIPHKKTIIVSDKVRYNDGSSFDIGEYKPCDTFLMCHEKAHRKVGGNRYNRITGEIIFDAEQACDNIAENYMLSHGFNPSQVKLAKQLILSSAKRRNCSQYNSKQMNFRR